MAESLYEILGVTKTATSDQIRTSYRKLARKHHPDVNPGDTAAEDRFKRISAAYEVLSDENKRAAYDEFGDAALAGGFNPDQARAYAAERERRGRAQSYGRRARSAHDDDQGPIEFDFADLFERQPTHGLDIHATVELDLRQAIEGAEVALEVPGQGKVRVRIPPGADTGSVIRLAGKGSPGARGGPPGDLVIETAVREHPHVRRDALDLYLSLPVSLDEAYNGASIDVPTFDGFVSLKLPPRSQNRAKLRLRGKGVPRKDTRGDLYVELDVRMPDKPDDALAEALRASASAYSAPVRAAVTL